MVLPRSVLEGVLVISSMQLSWGLWYCFPKSFPKNLCLFFTVKHLLSHFSHFTTGYTQVCFLAKFTEHHTQVD